MDLRSTLPVAGAVGVFGMLFGAAAVPILGVPLTVATSVFVFSGAAQFSMVGLLEAGASAWAVLGTVTILNLRHLPLGAVVRPRLREERGRYLLAWFLLDETVGLTLAHEDDDPGSVLIRAGVALWGAWVLGTVIGIMGGAITGLEALAATVFPVLFIGLASIMARSRDVVIRTVLAAAVTLGLLVLWPGLGGMAPIAAAVVVAFPGGWK